MLREFPNIRQPEDQKRRWFTDDYFDLIVWLDQREEINGFQLCYDVSGDEHALTWRKQTGFSHQRVDDGELQRPYKATPILVADGPFDPARVCQLFQERSAVMDEKVAKFVLDKIKALHSKGTINQQ